MKNFVLGVVFVVLTMVSISVLGVGIAGAVVNTENATIVHFDYLKGGGAGAYLPAGYAGLTWDPTWFFWSWDEEPYTPHSPETRISSHNFGGWIDFSPLGHDVEFVGAWFSGYNLTQVHFEGYNDGILVGTSESLAPGEVPAFLEAGFSGPVDRVVVVSTAFNFFCMDDLTYIGQIIPIDVDIKPGNCQNTFNPTRDDVLSVAILGRENFDVTGIDASTLQLEGIEPISFSIEEVGTPSACRGADGYPDLVLTFAGQEVSGIGAVATTSKGEMVPLTITGNLYDGQTIQGADVLYPAVTANGSRSPKK